MLVHVQFSDDSRKTILAVFAGPQDPEVWPNMGQVDDEDPRYVAHLNPPLAEAITDPREKLIAFLLANPDVAEIVRPPEAADVPAGG